LGTRARARAWPGHEDLLRLDEGRELARARGVAKLLQRLGLDLTDALAGHAEGAADLLERVLVHAAETEAHAQDALLARGEPGERLGEMLPERALLRRLVRIDAVGRLDQLAERGIAVLADRQVERGRLLHHRERALDLRHRDAGALGDLARRRI